MTLFCTKEVLTNAKDNKKAENPNCEPSVDHFFPELKNSMALENLGKKKKRVTNSSQEYKPELLTNGYDFGLLIKFLVFVFIVIILKLLAR